MGTAEIDYEPGDASLFPIGWWQKAGALDFSASMTYMHSLTPYEGHAEHPARV